MEDEECAACKALARTTFFGKPPKCPKHRDQGRTHYEQRRAQSNNANTYNPTNK